MMAHTEETGQFRIVRTYGEILLVSLLLLHVAAFVTYHWLERNDIKAELVAVARALPESGFGQHSGEIVQYPDGIVIARRVGTESRQGFSEEIIAGTDHLVYTVPGTDLIVAKSEHELTAETMRFGALLAVLFVSEVLILIGWWSFMKEKINELFFV